MAKQTIDRGTAANDGTGDNLRLGAGKINDNFDEIYNAIGDGTNLISGTIISDTSTSVLSNKTINSSNNTVTLSLASGTLSGTTAEFNTALSDNDFATLAGTEALTNKTINASLNTLTNISNGNLNGSAGITNANLANSSITLIDDTSTTDTVSLGESLRLTGGTGITSVVGSNEITFDIDSTVATLTGTQILTNKTIDAANNTLSNIANGSLSNSSIGIGGITFNLGDTDATPAFDLSDATNYPTTSLTGTITNAQLDGSIANAKLSNSSVTIGADTISLGGTQTTITDLDLDGTSSISGTGTIDTTGSGNKLRFNVAAVDAAALGAAISPTTYEGMFAYNTTENIAYVADTAGWTKLISENDSIGAISNVNISGIADNYMLKWDGTAARFNAVPLPIQSAAEFDVTNSGSSAYLFNSHYSGNNPTIYLIGGHTYAFNLAVSGHPFHIQTVSGAYASGSAYSTGMTHIADDGTVSTGASALLKQSGILYWKVPASISGNYYYVCQYHSGMAGTISIIDVTTL